MSVDGVSWCDVDMHQRLGNSYIFFLFFYHKKTPSRYCSSRVEAQATRSTRKTQRPKAHTKAQPPQAHLRIDPPHCARDDRSFFFFRFPVPTIPFFRPSPMLLQLPKWLRYSLFLPACFSPARRWDLWKVEVAGCDLRWLLRRRPARAGSRGLCELVDYQFHLQDLYQVMNSMALQLACCCVDLQVDDLIKSDRTIRISKLQLIVSCLLFCQ